MKFDAGPNGHVVFHELERAQVLPRLLQMLNQFQTSKRLGVEEATKVKLALAFSAMLAHSKDYLAIIHLDIMHKILIICLHDCSGQSDRSGRNGCRADFCKSLKFFQSETSILCNHRVKKLFHVPR